MIEAGILDGDYVVIEQRYSASNGEIVVALVRNEEVTLKRIEQKRGRWYCIQRMRGWRR